jgi:hypothetical protein
VVFMFRRRQHRVIDATESSATQFENCPFACFLVLGQFEIGHVIEIDQIVLGAPFPGRSPFSHGYGHFARRQLDLSDRHVAWPRYF